MYFGPVYNLTTDQRYECRIKQVQYAKKITKMIKNREYVVVNNQQRLSFRIVSILPSKNSYDVNEYRLNVEITKVESSYGPDTWVNHTPYEGERVRKYFMNKYKNTIQDELGVFLTMFGFGPRWGNGNASLYVETPKIINRR